MDKIEKALSKLTQREKELVEYILSKLQAGEMKDLDLKKLKGRNDIWRVRKGDIRIIYRAENKKIFLLAIERRNEKTYKF